MGQMDIRNFSQMQETGARRSFRFLGFCGVLALATGTLLNIVFGSNYPDSVVPHTSVVTPVVNGVCTVLAVVYVFFPLNRCLLMVILGIQCVYDVLTGFDILGLFLFMFINLLLFCDGWYKVEPRRKVICMLCGWLLTLFALIPFGIERFVFTIVLTIFMLATFNCIYHLLTDKLSGLLLDMESIQGRAKVSLPPPGSTLNLYELGLTERQCGCVDACLRGGISYRMLADRYNVSESAIKKDMSFLYRFFGVPNRELLRLLLTQYKILPL